MHTPSPTRTKARLELQAGGVSVALAFAVSQLPDAPESAGESTPDACESMEDSSAEVLLRAAAAAAPALLEVFAQTRSIVLASQVELLALRLDALRAAESTRVTTQGGAA